jgi:putative transposase
MKQKIVVEETESKEKVRIKYNRNDISIIHVFNPDTREYLAVPAINQDYTQNLSLAQHKIIQRYINNESQNHDWV